VGRVEQVLEQIEKNVATSQKKGLQIVFGNE
jgi:hypothetical protein